MFSSEEQNNGLDGELCPAIVLRVFLPRKAFMFHPIEHHIGRRLESDSLFLYSVGDAEFFVHLSTTLPGHGRF